MKRIVIALAAVAIATVATVGVVRVTGDSDAAPKPSTSQDQARQDLKDQSAEQAKQMRAAQDELTRKTREYAKQHPPVTAP